MKITTYKATLEAFAGEPITLPATWYPPNGEQTVPCEVISLQDGEALVKAEGGWVYLRAVGDGRAYHETHWCGEQLAPRWKKTKKPSYIVIGSHSKKGST